MAVCQQQKGGKRVGWCNVAATEAGVQPGMSDANAHAASSQLQSFARDETAEQKALQEAALCALRFTPSVTLQPFGILLEVSASLRLFNGARSIATQLIDGMRELGLQAYLASAPTASGAWLRARHGDGFVPERPQPAASTSRLAQMLDVLPVALLDTAQPYLSTLQGIGCHYLGELRRLPRAGVVRRFGAAVLRELDRAYGEEAEVFPWFEAPPIFEAKVELPARVENTDALLFATRRMLLQLAGWLTARHAAIAGFTLSLHHERGRQGKRVTPVVVVLGMPSRDADHLSLLLRERLAQIELQAPVIELSLVTGDVLQQAAPNTELFPTQTSAAESTGRLVERLQSRLGLEAVRRLDIVADHRPECGTATPALAASGITRRKEDALPNASPPRPAWLLAAPQPLNVQQHKPCYHGPLVLLAGPERIEAGWWDDALAARDYFVAQNREHQLLWIYRQRTLQEGRGSGWFLHGFFG